MLARRWAAWLTSAVASFLLWMGLTALAMSYPTWAPLGIQVAVDLSYALACASGFFSPGGLLALRRDAVADNRQLAFVSH